MSLILYLVDIGTCELDSWGMSPRWLACSPEVQVLAETLVPLQYFIWALQLHTLASRSFSSKTGVRALKYRR